MMKRISIFVEKWWSFFRRKAHGEAAAAVHRVFDPDLATVDGDDLAHKRKAEAVALGFVRAVPLLEFVKNAGLILAGDAFALVVDGEEHTAVFLDESHADQAAARAELDGVVDEIRPHVLE